MVYAQGKASLQKITVPSRADLYSFVGPTTLRGGGGSSVAGRKYFAGPTANAAAWRGQRRCLGCFINTLPYELIVHESNPLAPQQIQGKAYWPSRGLAVPRTWRRAYIDGGQLKLEPDKRCRILSRRSTGKIGRFRTVR